MKNVVTLLAVVGTCAPLALAVPRESYSFAGPFSVLGRPLTPPNTDPFVTANVTGVANVAPTGGSYTAARLRITGSIETFAQTSANPASQCRIDVFPPTGLPFTVTPSASAAAAPSNVNFTVNIAIPADVTSTVGSWGFQFYDLTNSGVGADASFSNIVVSMDDGTIAADSDLGTLASGATPATGINVAAQEIKWVKFVLPSDADAATNTFCDIFTTAGGDTEIGLYRNDGTLVANDDDGLGGFGLSILTFGTGETQAAPSNGNDGTLAAGTYWLAVGMFNSTFAADGFGAVNLTGLDSTIDVEIRRGNFVPPPDLPAPAGTIAVGTLGNSVYTNTSDYAATEFKWFSFTTPVAAPVGGDKYVDIWTLADAYLGTNTFQNDTQIGLYRANGQFIVGDDQAGGNNLSALTFGDNVNVRTTGDANTALLNGNDGGLAAGNYYLAVGGWIMNFGPALNVTSTGDDAGPVTVKIGSNFAPTCVCCNLSNVAGANQSTTPDDVLTADDIIVFLGWFFANDARANVAGANQSTVPDNVLTADDIIVFLGRYFAGC